MALFKKKLPQRPSINDEQAFIEWMMKYDDQFNLMREYIGKKYANVIKLSVQEILHDLNTHNNGQALLNHLCVISDNFQNIMPLIEKRGGVLNSPPEMQSAFIALTTKMTILPYFVKYKYGLSLPFEFEGD